MTGGCGEGEIGTVSVAGLLVATSCSGKEMVGGAGAVAVDGELGVTTGGAMLRNPCHRLESYERTTLILFVPLGGRTRCRFQLLGGVDAAPRHDVRVRAGPTSAPLGV